MSVKRQKKSEAVADLRALMGRCALAMFNDEPCYFSSPHGNGDSNAYEAAGALDEVAAILGIPSPTELLDALYEEPPS